MRTVTPTVYGAAIQTAQYLNKPYLVQENSTLNEKFGIQANAVPTNEDRHGVLYYCIGNGGHRAVTGADGFVYTTTNQHSATDAACFNHIPFVLRETSEDLSVEQRQRYALRREETHNGRRYFAYYAKALSLDNVSVNLYKTRMEDGSQVSEPFIPTTSNLNPTPLSDTEDENNVIEVSGEYVSSNAVTTIAFTETDANELRNVARILYGNESYAIVSEIGLIGAVKKLVSGAGPGTTQINYQEAIAAQIAMFVSTYYQLNMQNNGFTFTADIGITEPLFASIPGA